MIDPARLTPREWAESDARRRQRREDLQNPYGRSLSPRTRIVLGWILALAALAAVVASILGLGGVLDIFPPPA